MYSDRLPPPIPIAEGQFNNLKETIEYVYEDYFKKQFMDKDKRVKLNEKFIYLRLEFLNFKPERFWHLISFNPSEEKYTVDPCTNAEDLLLCKEVKIECYKHLQIPKHYKLNDRAECMYRLRRINWINPILKLANKKDKSVKIWHEDMRGLKNKIVRKVFIRFQDGLADYLIILIDNSINNKQNYTFVTAYPVVHNGTRRNLNKGFEKFITE